MFSHQMYLSSFPKPLSSQSSTATASSRSSLHSDASAYLCICSLRIPLGMRESNFAFPAQNKACVCITSQLYDRRALDTNSPLPLLNSLTHLTYLTSTSPRIREILTCDGGLERLVRILKDFCYSPPPPENSSAISGLAPHGLPRPARVPVLNPSSFDRHAAYRFSLAFQCVVNIGVRGSEPMRSRVVQSGTLDVVGCILEAWLASKGFAVGPSASASGMPRETREQRQQRRQQQLEQRQREQAQELVRLLALERSLANAAEEEQSVATSDAETSVSADTSANSTPSRSGTPTSTVIAPGRDRSGTVVARRVWDGHASNRDQAVAGPSMSRSRTIRARMDVESTTPSTSTSRPDTETEDDGEPDADGDVEMDASRSRNRNMDENIPPASMAPHGRRAVGIVTDHPSPTTTAVVGAGVAGTSDALDVDMDAHIIINTNATDDGVADGIVALDQNVNDDLAMGAPPGAPGAIDATPRTRTNTLTLNTRNINLPREHHHHSGHGREELTPRAVLASLPMHINHPHDIPRPQAPAPIAIPVTANNPGPSRPPEFGQGVTRQFINAGATTGAAPPPNTAAPPRPSHRHHHHHHAEEQGPYREDDVLLGLQLLAYLSKYPHVRQAFYKPRLSFHPATAMAQGQNIQASAAESLGWRRTGAGTRAGVVPATVAIGESKRDIGFFKTLTGRGKEKEKEKPLVNATSSTQPMPSTAQSRMTNVFSLVERFTFRPSPTESSLPQPPPFLPHDIQYWAGVVMRNACRRDDNRGGLRQCANMLCGKWESFPREFAKCRRCRKAKYCGKECQSRAWSEGHRFWCSAREGEEGEVGEVGPSGIGASTTAGGATFTVQPVQNAEEVLDGEHSGSGAAGASRTTLDRIERRQARDRERQRMTNAASAALAAMQPAPSVGAALTTARNASSSSTGTVQRGHASRPSGSNTSENPFPAVPAATQFPAMHLDNLDYSLALLNQRQSAVPGPSISPTLPWPPVNGAANELALPSGFNLNGYSPEQQDTIRTFLQAVGIADLEGDNLLPPAPRVADASMSVPGPGDVNVEIEYHQRGRERERERLLPERIQAMNVGDRMYPPADAGSTSTSRSPGGDSSVSTTDDDSMEVVD